MQCTRDGARRMVRRGRIRPGALMPASPAAAETGGERASSASADPVRGMARPPHPRAAPPPVPSGRPQTARRAGGRPAPFDGRPARTARPARSGSARSNGGSGPGVPAGPDRRDLRAPHPGGGRLVPGQARAPRRRPRDARRRAAPARPHDGGRPEPASSGGLPRGRRAGSRPARAGRGPLGRGRGTPVWAVVGLALLAFAVGFAAVAIRAARTARPRPRPRSAARRAIGYVRVARQPQRRLEAHAVRDRGALRRPRDGARRPRHRRRR